MHHDHRAFPCSKGAPPKVTLTPLCSRARLLSRTAQEMEMREETGDGDAGEDWQVQCKMNVPVTPHCSPDRSVSGTRPAGVALGGKLYNP